MRLLMVAFALSLVGLLSWLAYFVLSVPGAAIDRVGVGPGLWLTAGLAAGVALTSGLLAFHHKLEAYGGGEEVLFRSCLIVSTGILLCSGLYACAIQIFG